MLHCIVGFVFAPTKKKERRHGIIIIIILFIYLFVCLFIYLFLLRQLTTSAVWGLPCGALDLEFDAEEEAAHEWHSQCDL